jgi:hypothetical protein
MNANKKCRAQALLMHSRILELDAVEPSSVLPLPATSSASTGAYSPFALDVNSMLPRLLWTSRLWQWGRLQKIQWESRRLGKVYPYPCCFSRLSFKSAIAPVSTFGLSPEHPVHDKTSSQQSPRHNISSFDKLQNKLIQASLASRAFLATSAPLKIGRDASPSFM